MIGIRGKRSEKSVSDLIPSTQSNIDRMTETNKETLLFVDDEESILEVASEYFKAKGYNILTAENGRIAADIIANRKIDCCFTDINMPEMDGLELAEHIRLVDNTIPVIIMTGYPSLDNTIRTLKNGVVDFLIKPVNLNQLEICVKRVLRERQLFIKNIFLTKEVEGKQRIENAQSGTDLQSQGTQYAQSHHDPILPQSVPVSTCSSGSWIFPLN